MSDGVTDDRRVQERFFEALRKRLLAEELLYGSYNPEICPNLVRQDDDWCVPDGRFCGPCHAMWCEGCHAHFGPWGAWRSVVDEVLDHFLVLIDVSAHCGDRIVAGVHLDLAEPARFAAAGWLP